MIIKILRAVSWKTKLVFALALMTCGLAANAHTGFQGITGPTFNLTVKDGYISTPEGGSIYTWGYAVQGQPMQYPGPTLIVNQGDVVTINLTNEMPFPVSMVFPGQENVSVSGGSPGVMTNQISQGAGAVTYVFTAANPGTYQYHSGTNPALQVEMGMVGALVVRSATPHQAYNHPDSAYSREYMFLFTEMDPVIHELVETGRASLVDFSKYRAAYWFINGRCSPDTMAMPNDSWLPHQPYNAMPRMHPGEKMLLRIISAGRDLHPWHTHGNHMLVIAKDGRLLESAPGAGADLAELNFAVTLPPGGTADAIFQWTGEKLGWDVYGHSPGDPLQPNEYAPDHGKPFPVVLPDPKDTTSGAFYSGSPFLGAYGFIPPGSSLMNLSAGYFYMWHSHKEREMVNNNIFPGGLMTMLIIEPPSVVIE